MDAIFAALTANSQAMGGRLLDTGRSLLFAIGAMVLAIKMVKTMTHPNGPAPVISEVVSLAFTFGLLLYFINNWNYVFFQSFIGGFDYIAAKISGGASASSGIALGATALMKIAQDIWEAAPALAKSPIEVMTNFPAFILGSLIRLAIMLILILIGAVYAAMLTLSQILLTVAAVLLPAFLPFLLIEQLSWIATGAMRFAVVSALYKIVGIFVITLMQPVIPVLGRIAASADQSGAVDVAAMGTLLAFSLTLLFFSLQIASIANGLVSGHVAATFRVPQVPKAGGDKAAGKD
ncbi:MAG: type IV secretion system protein [Rhodocyclaceae bacterium]|nr:type IV secretion system protein [Rhodocyclaceae bacterium]